MRSAALLTRIYNSQAQQCASLAVFQAVNGCAAHHSCQVLTLHRNYQVALPPPKASLQAGAFGGKKNCGIKVHIWLYFLKHVAILSSQCHFIEEMTARVGIKSFSHIVDMLI